MVTVDNDSRLNSNQICVTQNAGKPPNPGVQLVLQCIQPIVGRFVTIKRLGGFQPNVLRRCAIRVQVIGDFIGKAVSSD